MSQNSFFASFAVTVILNKQTLNIPFVVIYVREEIAKHSFDLTHILLLVEFP